MNQRVRDLIIECAEKLKEIEANKKGVAPTTPGYKNKIHSEFNTKREAVR